MYTNFLQHEASYQTPHGPVLVYSDVPEIPPEVQFPRSLTAEQVMGQAEKDLKEMKLTGQESVLAFYARKEHDVRKGYNRFYFAKWGEQRIMTSTTMPTKAEVLEALDEFRSANGLAPRKTQQHGEKFDELVGKLIQSAG